MNWRNVLRLISVDTKAGRLIRGQRLRRYRERKIFQYLLYGGACVLGLAIGIGAGSLYTGVGDPDLRTLFYQGAQYVFLSLPTLALIFSLVFTMMRQIQRMGVRASLQPPYWLPITWQEHTLASTLANLIGIPFAFLILLSSAIAAVSIYLEQVPLAALTVFALLASAFLASTTTEIFRILQVRLTGAVYKSTGKAAIWVRFIGSMLFLIVFYVVWFAFTSGTGYIALINAVAGAQEAVWFVPYVWLGMVLVAFASGLLAQTVIFSLASLLFILVLFYVAVKLNTRFGLYEPPAITVSRGAYVPKVGFLGRLGFSSLESAMMKKDFKAFTRRRELIYIFIFPIIFAIMPLLSFMSAGADTLSQVLYSFLFAYLTLLPGTFMVMILGSWMIGLEGRSVWFVYSSPISARSLIKAKYSFAVLFSLAVALVCSIVSSVLATPSTRIAAICLVEVMLLIFSLGMVSLSFGIRGADFRELPRPRMIRAKWSIINGIVCFLLALAIVSPITPYAVELFLEAVQAPAIMTLHLPEAYLYAVLPISGTIAFIVAYVFYRIALKNAEKFLIKAEI